MTKMVTSACALAVLVAWAGDVAAGDRQKPAPVPSPEAIADTVARRAQLPDLAAKIHTTAGEPEFMVVNNGFAAAKPSTLRVTCKVTVGGQSTNEGPETCPLSASGSTAEMYVGDLAPGAHKEFKLTAVAAVPASSWYKGRTYQFVAVADAGQVLAEVKKTNNQSAQFNWSK